MIALALAAQVAVVAEAPRTALVCQPVTISVAARAPGRTAPRIHFPSTSALQLLKESVQIRVEREATGLFTTIAEAAYVVAAARAGRLELPAVVAEVGSQRGSAPIGEMLVRDGGRAAPLVLVRARLARPGSGERVDSLVVGEQVDYVVDVQLNAPARERLRHNPTFFPPDMPLLLAYDLPAPGTVGRDGGRCFETLTYRRALFPLFAGDVRIAPAVLTYSLPVSTSFFSREESFDVHTDSVRLLVHDPPLALRPPGYLGAVGELSANARLQSDSTRQGDPVTLTVRVEGTGNVKLWPRPEISLPWATLATAAERVEIDSTHARIGGAKEFDWVLTPRRAGAAVVGGLEYPFFSPERGAYIVVRTTPLTLHVAPAALARADTQSVPPLPLRRALGEPRPVPLADRPAYWILLALAPLPAALRRSRRRVRRWQRGGSARHALTAAARASPPLSAGELRRTFLAALDERLSTRVSRRDLERDLRRAGVSEAWSARAADLLERLDRAAFSPFPELPEGAATTVVVIFRAVDREAVTGPPSLFGGVGSRGAVVVASAALLLAAPAHGAREFTHGLDAYDRGDYAAAERAFARTASRLPRVLEAWADMGNAAWQRGDSAAAAYAWQRAARLDPLDSEMRERLAALQPPSLRARGTVVPLPPDALAGAGLVLWYLGWLAALLPERLRPLVRPVRGAVIALALVLVALSVQTRRRLDPRGLAVVRRTSDLLDDASRAAGRLASVRAGETGAVDGREGRWVHITLDPARSGWMPRTAVRPLEGDPLDD